MSRYFDRRPERSLRRRCILVEGKGQRRCISVEVKGHEKCIWALGWSWWFTYPGISISYLVINEVRAIILDKTF